MTYCVFASLHTVLSRTNGFCFVNGFSSLANLASFSIYVQKVAVKTYVYTSDGLTSVVTAICFPEALMRRALGFTQSIGTDLLW